MKITIQLDYNLKLCVTNSYFIHPDMRNHMGI